MYCFLVGLHLDVGFENELEALATVWSNDRDMDYALGLVTGF
jgi:hypothetical protein